MDGTPTDPAAAKIITTDIDHFWAAYDAAQASGLAAPYQTYLDQGSVGLKDFAKLKAVTAFSLAQMVGTLPRYFAAIRPNMLRLATNDQLVARIRANYVKIKSLYPNSIFPPVTFLVGRFNTGGTVSANGLLIGTEFFSIDPTTPLDELSAFALANVQPLDTIPYIVAHEHTHILQAHASKLSAKSNKTLLDQALLEGSADFIGELASGGHILRPVYAYGFANEQEVWTDFKTVMGGTNISAWLYNQGQTPGPRPGDLGYFIGYRIAQAYYDKATDKSAAIREIIEMTDGQAFLAASGYNGG